eukprot:7378465-Prymnesium_polylepis.1
MDPRIFFTVNVRVRLVSLSLVAVSSTTPPLCSVPLRTMPVALKSGSLHKEGKSRLLWKEHFFVLSDSPPVLSYYTTAATWASGEEPLGSSLLQGCVLSNTKSGRKGRYAFRLNLLVTPYKKGRTEKFILACVGLDDARGWIEALKATGLDSDFSESVMRAHHAGVAPGASGAPTSAASGAAAACSPR